MGPNMATCNLIENIMRLPRLKSKRIYHIYDYLHGPIIVVVVVMDVFDAISDRVGGEVIRTTI